MCSSLADFPYAESRRDKPLIACSLIACSQGNIQPITSSQTNRTGILWTKGLIDLSGTIPGQKGQTAAFVRLAAVRAKAVLECKECPQLFGSDVVQTPPGRPCCCDPCVHQALSSPRITGLCCFRAGVEVAWLHNSTRRTTPCWRSFPRPFAATTAAAGTSRNPMPQNTHADASPSRSCSRSSSGKRIWASDGEVASPFH